MAFKFVKSSDGSSTFERIPTTINLPDDSGNYILSRASNGDVSWNRVESKGYIYTESMTATTFAVIIDLTINDIVQYINTDCAQLSINEKTYKLLSFQQYDQISFYIKPDDDVKLIPNSYCTSTMRFVARI